MNTDENGVCHISPKSGILHTDIVHTAAEALTSGVGCGTVVAVATKYMVVEDIAGGKDIQSVAPTWMGDAANIVECDTIAPSYRTSAECDPIDENVFTAMHMHSFVAIGRTADATTNDTDILSVFNGKRSVDVAPWSKIDNGGGWNADDAA